MRRKRAFRAFILGLAQLVLGAAGIAWTAMEPFMTTIQGAAYVLGHLLVAASLVWLLWATILGLLSWSDEPRRPWWVLVPMGLFGIVATTLTLLVYFNM